MSHALAAARHRTRRARATLNSQLKTDGGARLGNSKSHFKILNF